MLASFPRTAEHLSRHLLRLAHGLAHSRRRYTQTHTCPPKSGFVSAVFVVAVYTGPVYSAVFLVVVFVSRQQNSRNTETLH